MTSQLTVSLQDNIFELIQTLGEPSIVVPAAVRQYVVDRSLQRVKSAEQQIRVYEKRYKTDYHTFNRRVTTDHAFLNGLNRDNPMWKSTRSSGLPGQRRLNDGGSA